MPEEVIHPWWWAVIEDDDEDQDEEDSVDTSTSYDRTWGEEIKWLLPYITTVYVKFNFFLSWHPKLLKGEYTTIWDYWEYTKDMYESEIKVKLKWREGKILVDQVGGYGSTITSFQVPEGISADELEDRLLRSYLLSIWPKIMRCNPYSTLSDIVSNPHDSDDIFKEFLQLWTVIKESLLGYCFDYEISPKGNILKFGYKFVGDIKKSNYSEFIGKTFKCSYKNTNIIDIVVWLVKRARYFGMFSISVSCMSHPSWEEGYFIQVEDNSDVDGHTDKWVNEKIKFLVDRQYGRRDGENISPWNIKYLKEADAKQRKELIYEMACVHEGKEWNSDDCDRFRKSAKIVEVAQ